MSTESKTTHTPGPWKLEHVNGALAWILIAPNTTDLGKYKADDAADNNTAWANATLIAAAPEMLDTLKRVRSELIKIKWDETGPVISDISDVIAKAEGR